jgi:CDP-4-dehydro-6-deoxyglucose reductase, E3
MPRVGLGNNSFELQEQESVLDCLLRNSQPIAYACRSGACQSCLCKAVKGMPSGKAQAGLKSTLQAQGYALACQWVPEHDVEVRLPGADEGAIEASIAGLSRLNAGVMRLLLRPATDATDFSCRPGQYLNLGNAEGVSRSYSAANDLLRDGFLEFHIASTAQGLFTKWLFTRAKVGDTLHLRGPAGDCFYVPDQDQQFPMLLVGTGTGLAPLWGIANDALVHGHQGPISLLQGGTAPERLYYVDELHRLQQANAGFHYQALVLQGTGSDSRILQGDLVEHALAALDPGRLKETRVYLCGAPDFVQSLRKRIFLKGVSSANIFCDAFVTRVVAAA